MSGATNERSEALIALGWNATLEQLFSSYRELGFEAARVAVEDKHQFMVVTATGELPALVTGRFLHEASSAELPKVGDWAVIARVSREEKALIHHILPRRTRLSRKVPGRETEEQVLVTNIDIVFVVQALDRRFNPQLLQRHLTMVFEGGAQPMVLLNKADLEANLEEVLERARGVAGTAPVLAISAATGQGFEELSRAIAPGLTVAFIGTSGVGKSTLINRLYGDEVQATTEVRETDAKGRHTTTCREMLLLRGGGLVIDTPGMREFHLWSAGEGLHDTFQQIEDLAGRCHFRSCGHTVESRCAVLEALQNGELPRERYDAYLKLRKELAELGDAQDKRLALERKRRTKVAQRAFNKLKRHTHEEFE